MKGTVHYEARGAVALLTIDNPPVNPLSGGVRQGLYDGMERALSDDAIQAIVLTGAGRAFIAGADISEFGQAGRSGVDLGQCMARMEGSQKPVVAAINGTAFGGGLEVALCCDFRIAAPKAQVGLPEVKLGLLPGAGGTQRLPRLVGAEQALNFMLTGQGVLAPQAKELGIVDEIAQPDQLVATAIAMAIDKAEKGETRKIRDESDKISADQDHQEIFSQARKLAARQMRGQFAPEMIIQCVEAAVRLDDFEAGIKVERGCFSQCLQHPQRAAMIHVFFAERQVAKIPFLAKDTPLHEVGQAGVVGCGTMGGGITMCFANAGIPVTVLETDEEALARGLGVIRRNYQSQVDRGRISAEQMEKCMSLITGVTDYAGLANVDMAVEAVYENLDLKIKVFKQLDEAVQAGALLMSNTSGLNVDKIAESTSRPGLVAGMHFFSPANIMRLLEVVHSKHSLPGTIATAMAIGRKLGKISVLAGNCPGFIGNRMLSGYTQQAAKMILEGATPFQVDGVMGQFGMPMGPFQMGDLVGLDLGWRARKLAGVEMKDRPHTALIPDRLCDMGRYGQKNGRGYYIYEAGSRAGVPDPEVISIAEAVSAELGVARRDISDEEILQRALYPLINEGARILAAGIALRSSDIDIVYINGYGFPGYKGGPMFYADEIGLQQIHADMLKLQEKYGDEWQPAELLTQLAKENKGFKDFVASSI